MAAANVLLDGKDDQESYWFIARGLIDIWPRCWWTIRHDLVNCGKLHQLFIQDVYALI